MKSIKINQLCLTFVITGEVVRGADDEAAGGC